MALVAILILATAGAIYWTAARSQAYELNGRVLSPAEQAPALDLTDQHGNPFTLAQELGKVAAVSFGSTHCDDTGVTTLNTCAIVKNALGEDAYQADFIYVTFDPENDTQERLNERLAPVDPAIIGLRGTNEQTAQLLDAYAVAVERTGEASPSSGCQFDYEPRISLIDKDGNLRVTYLPGTDPQKTAQDIEHLANE
jgi:protein SCO1/2